MSAEEGAGESKRTRLDCREGDPDSLRQRREGDVLAGECEGLKRQRRAPEPRDATSTIACWERREDEACVSATNRAISDSAKRVRAHKRRGQENQKQRQRRTPEGGARKEWKTPTAEQTAKEWRPEDEERRKRKKDIEGQPEVEPKPKEKQQAKEEREVERPEHQKKKEEQTE